MLSFVYSYKTMLILNDSDYYFLFNQSRDKYLHCTKVPLNSIYRKLQDYVCTFSTVRGVGM